MNYGEGGTLSASDVALLTGRNTNSDGFGNGDGWWVIIFLIFALGGFGRNGFGGGYGSGSGGVGENYVLATDFATIERKLDSVNSGLCDGFYAMAQQFSNTNQNIFNGNAALQQTLCQGFGGVNQAIVTNGYETRLGINSIASQLADCCCQTSRAIDGVNYNMATNTCAITNAINTGIRDIVDNQNANYRALHDEIVANRIEDKNAQIVAQQNEINALRLKASQEAQNNYLVSQLGTKCPEAAYIVPNPNCCYNYSVNGFGYGNGCGCGCN